MNSQSSLPRDTQGLHTIDRVTQLFSSSSCKKPQTRRDEVYTTFRVKMSLQILQKYSRHSGKFLSYSFCLKLIHILCHCKKYQCSWCSVCSQNNAYIFFLPYIIRLQFFRLVGFVSRDVLRSQVFEQWFSALCVWHRFRDHSKTADAHF